jgi:hypothetical protein
MAKDESSRLFTGAGQHGDRRMKRNNTRQAQEDEYVKPVCDKCGRKNANVSTGWQMLCIECRREEELDDVDYGSDYD